MLENGKMIEEKMAVAWIFQGPKTFDVDAYLRAPRRQWRWTVRQRHFKDQFAFGDPVFIWRSDGFVPRSGGIVARGLIIGQPEERPDDVKELLDGLIRLVGIGAG